jgi:hypothetical protein
MVRALLSGRQRKTKECYRTDARDWIKRTTETIDRGSSAATAGTDALVKWTKALVVATAVYVLFTGGLLWVSLQQLASR